MHYIKIYDNIIEKAKTRKLEDYGEKHHIIPKCLGGNNLEENLVKLSFREHFICHWLLCKIYPNDMKILHAFSSMIRVSQTNSKRWEYLTSRHFEIVKRLHAPIIGKWNIGKKPWNKGLSGEKYLKHYKDGYIKLPNMTGYKWINDGQKQTKISSNVEIPEGWKRGRMDMTGNKNPMRDKNIATKNANKRKKRNEIQS